MFHPMPIDPREAARAWFLGPQAENAELLERLVVEAVRDHVFWRRNLHPEDGVTIHERDKRAPGYVAATETLTQEFTGLLARLKRDLPFFSGRYLGHMLYEQTLAAQVGYFAAMLYNPNNVAADASPVTTRLELEVAADLARMVGYAPPRAWGHLTSGGTLANFEALWIARQVHYLPLAVAAAARELGVTVEAKLPDGGRRAVTDLELWQLLNLDPAAALDLRDALLAAAPGPVAPGVLDAHGLAARGYQDYSLELARRYGDALPAAVVLVAATAHYSWEKLVRALGIGGQQLRVVPVDTHCRMDPDALWEELRRLSAARTPVLAVVSVCGTTEESACDRLDLITEVRAQARAELGTTFHLHSDACYGGYAAAVTWRADGTRRTAADIRGATGTEWPSEMWVRSMEALATTDSISIDPHKLGYVPYPAGAFLLRDRRGRDLVAVDPPYLEPGGADPAGEQFLGRYSIEGSRPGAAAAATWMSHKVLPLDERGYGHLIERSVVGARRLHAALAAADLGGCRIALLPAPDLNIVNFALRHPRHRTLAEVNAFNEGLYRALSPRPDGRAPEYYVTRTRLAAPKYDGAIAPLLEALGLAGVDEWRAAGPEGLVVLRMTVMDPFLAEPAGATDHVAGFLDHLRALATA